MASVTTAITNFVTAIFGVFVSLFQSLLAVFQAVFALVGNVVHSITSIIQHFVQMVLDLFQGAAGFVAGKCFHIYLAVLISRNSEFPRDSSRWRDVYCL